MLVYKTPLWDLFWTQETWEDAVRTAQEKELNESLIRKLCTVEGRTALMTLILNGYRIAPPRNQKIPKDEPNEFRTVYINSDLDRIILSIVNDCLFKLFEEFVHPACKSYQKGLSSQTTVKEVSQLLVAYGINSHEEVGYKYDFSKYFDKVDRKAVFDLINKLERYEKSEQGKDIILNIIRDYYMNDAYLDEHGKLIYKYQGLKQGCAVASFFADALLYELDEYMSKKYRIYIRYSDDLIVIHKNKTSHMTSDIETIISKYGVTLNPKKIKPIYTNIPFTFLGFKIRGNEISLSKRRLEKFENMVLDNTIRCNKTTCDKARKRLLRVMCSGDYCWADSCLGTINSKHDIMIMNGFIMDALRAAEFGNRHTKLGGLGSCDDLKEGTVSRGKGKQVKTFKEKMPYIENYLSLQCLIDNYLCGKAVFHAVINQHL